MRDASGKFAPKPKDRVHVNSAKLMGHDGEWWLVVEWQWESGRGPMVTEIVDISEPARG